MQWGKVQVGGLGRWASSLTGGGYTARAHPENGCATAAAATRAAKPLRAPRCGRLVGTRPDVIGSAGGLQELRCVGARKAANAGDVPYMQW